MPRSTVVKSDRSQAVRLPKAAAFPEDVHQVEIIKLGQARLNTPSASAGTIFSGTGRISRKIS
jgi:antitoxin VapB